MKKLLLILLIALIVAAGALAIFVLTFDVDRYRPMVVAELQKTIGQPVRLAHISLGWRGGLAMRLDGFAIDQDAQHQLEPMVQVESASASVRLAPLLKKELQVASIVLRHPQIHIDRGRDGRVNLLGAAAVVGPAAGPQRAVVSGTPVAFNIASFQIEDGSLHWTDAMVHPPTDMWIRRLDVLMRHITPGRPMDVALNGALASTTQNLQLSGRVTLPDANQPGAVEHLVCTLDDTLLADVLPSPGPGEPQLRGRLSLSWEGGLPTLEPTRLVQAISAKGRLQLADPSVTNLNLLRAVFERFSMLPTLMQTLESRLPPEYQAKLAAKDTVFSPIDLSMQIDEGALRFEDVHVSTDTFRLAGSGRLGFDGALHIQSTLRVEPALSQALIASVNELQGIATPQGELEIPLTIQGQAPRIAVLPDLQAVASKILVTKAVDLLGRLLQKEQSGDASQQSAPQTGDAPLGQFLQRVLQKP